jgi:nicotinamide-nucleotide amidase
MHDLVHELTELLAAKNMTLVTAESCTGGLLAATITHKSGVTRVYECGFVTYSNDSKTDLIGVDPKILETHGAVSPQTAEAMARGAIEKTKAHLAVSITGIAGPDGGTAKKPVGLVYFGYALKGGSVGSLEHRFSGSRQEIQTAATIMALKHLIAVLHKE